VPLATALCKTFLLGILNNSITGQNQQGLQSRLKKKKKNRNLFCNSSGYISYHVSQHNICLMSLNCFLMQAGQSGLSINLWAGLVPILHNCLPATRCHSGFHQLGQPPNYMLVNWVDLDCISIMSSTSTLHASVSSYQAFFFNLSMASKSCCSLAQTHSSLILPRVLYVLPLARQCPTAYLGLATTSSSVHMGLRPLP